MAEMLVGQCRLVEAPRVAGYCRLAGAEREHCRLAECQQRMESAVLCLSVAT